MLTDYYLDTERNEAPLIRPALMDFSFPFCFVAHRLEMETRKNGERLMRNVF